MQKNHCIQDLPADYAMPSEKDAIHVIEFFKIILPPHRLQVIEIFFSLLVAIAGMTLSPLKVLLNRCKFFAKDSIKLILFFNFNNF